MTKSETLAIRVTPEEKADIQKEAEKLDMSVSKYLYNLLIKKQKEAK